MSLLALLLSHGVLIASCGEDDAGEFTNDEACDILATAMCEQGVECGVYDDIATCEAELHFACCEQTESCGYPSDKERGLVEECATFIRLAPCGDVTSCPL
jgi:hypothetical protein